MPMTRQTHNLKQHAAVFRLPNELLLEVFAWELDTQWATLSPAREKLYVRFIRSVTAVCSHWRQVAISDTLLWRRLSIANHPTEGYDDISHRLRTFLARSKNVTLDVGFYIHGCDRLSKNFQCLVDMLLRHIQRCRTLVIVYDDDGVEHKPFIIKPSGPLVNLTNLRIKSERWAHPSLSFEVLAPDNMVALRSLDLDFDDRCHIQKLDGLQHLRTERLHRLSIRCYGRDGWFPDIMGFISRYADVEYLSLGLEFPDEEDEQAYVKPFVLAKVTEFIDTCHAPVLSLSRIISMPALERLTLGGNRLMIAKDAKSHVAYLTCPRLRSITFDSWWLEEYTVPFLHTLFRAHPTIEDIHVEGCFNHSMILIAMICTMSEDELEVLPPKLEPLDMIYGPKPASNTLLPVFKRLHFSRQYNWDGTLPDNIAYMVALVLVWWESARVEIKDWESYGGDRTDTKFLMMQYPGRFSFLGDHPPGPDAPGVESGDTDIADIDDDDVQAILDLLRLASAEDAAIHRT